MNTGQRQRPASASPGPPLRRSYQGRYIANRALFIVMEDSGER
jgi:hypothetical protein